MCEAAGSNGATFQAAAPIEKWLTDITEFQIPAGKVYLRPVIDCFDGLVINWSIGTRPGAELVNTMTDVAIEKVANYNDRPVVHSDRGAHYRWPCWLSRISDAKLIRSMSRKGCSPDNAACYGFFGRLKMELFYPRDRQATTIDQFIEAVDCYIRWYNESGSKSRLAHSVPSNTGRALRLQYKHKQVQDFCHTPGGSILGGHQQWSFRWLCFRLRQPRQGPLRPRRGWSFSGVERCRSHLGDADVAVCPICLRACSRLSDGGISMARSTYSSITMSGFS
ncbi:integrase-like protein [Paraburkholderia sp. BL9I2N2]|nr:integrase-like protein [Paraburkholderia sp. BL9I2N2]